MRHFLMILLAFCLFSFGSTVFSLSNSPSIDNQRAFIERFYQNILARASDTQGMQYWLNIMNSGSAAQVSFGFFNSPEFTQLNLDNSAFVRLLYQTLFDRPADEDGYQNWLSQLNNGSLRETIIYGFLKSQEFINLTQRFGVRDFTVSDNKTYQLKGFTGRFYSLVLDRQPDRSGFNNWVRQLADGTNGGADLARGFFNSAEFINRGMNNSAFIDTAYRAFFDRQADSGGKANWLALLSGGATRQQVLDGFIFSQEFADLATSFDISVEVVPFDPQDETFKFAAFNAFDAATFASSSCLILPIEYPSGIFVAVDGKSTASGTQDKPLDLATALSASSPVQPGQTLWIEEGIYTGSFVSELRGTSAQPIKVKPLPGQRVILDGKVSDLATLRINGQWTDYYGLEVISSSTKHASTQNSSNPSDLSTNGGPTIFGANTKLINFIVHDNVGGGVSSWSTAIDSEIYGNIIYNNGWTAPGRGHGHAIYAQNNTGIKKLTDNIIFFGYGTGIHVYTEGGQINNFDVQGNTWFMTGASDPRASQRKDNCLIGGFQPVKNLVMKNNLGFSMNSRGTRIGYGGSVNNENAVLTDNYLVENFWVAGNWADLNVNGTSVFRGVTGSVTDIKNTGAANDFRTAPPASGKKVFVKANAYDPRRARVVIYNYDESDRVSVDLSSVLKSGEVYRVHSVFGLFNEPLLSGIYDGQEVSIPMDTVRPPQPTGMMGISDTEDDPHKKFAVFIVTHGGCQ